ncbi:sulfotransferase family protein [Yoonia maricola]|uniref:Sulfotransferase family protein n=1 Tax=Yoonia maricola TaxID=420999 RepID=A0A2M8WP06_9RHOB|nr:sulfotransferase family 2 domain-containing protein [Yoonia maricola]PJI92672.1 sulfotransferase family protein [Yoonia maricola]
MPAFRFRDKLILFIHIPKAGGTSIKSWMSEHAAESLYMKHRSEMFPLVPQHFHAELLDELFAPAFFDYSFCVTRNPYSRALSEYNYRITRPRLKNKLLPKPSFESWLQKSFARYKKDPYIFSNHLRPQHMFPIAETEVFRLEDGLEPLQERLAMMTGIGFAADLPHKNPSQKSVTAISDEAAAQIRAFYADDFKRFDYDPDNWSDI